ncbi:MAG: hypothetical protein GY847_12750 [Proteobacteria bacterium]|nr:hypothetical protein [Pseudomonadota bacterium]
MNWLLYPYRRIRLFFLKKRLIKYIKDDVAEEFLQALLKLMSLYIALDFKFLRRILHRIMPNKVRYYGMKDRIRNFNGLIQFRSKDYEIRVLAEFGKNRLQITELQPEDKLKNKPNATVIFKNSKALMNYLLPKGGIDGKRDILGSILRNEVILEGNFNYIYRFGFLANHIQLEIAEMLD